ncbi:hypothetical protein GOBAR_DD33093 [Gossypium barbadense]|nr:hypothetical protein GOBAR_DD33093 [Gossypium barbadense]
MGTVVARSNEAGKDTLIWRWSQHGAFSESDTYKAVAGTNGGAKIAGWDLIWKCDIPQRVKQFRWLVIPGHKC